MQNWGEALLIADCYQEHVRRIENRYIQKGDGFVNQQPLSVPVIRLINRLRGKSKAAAL